MGQKVHPHGFRVGIIRDWDSRWYARQDKVGELIVEDYKIREYLKKTLAAARVPRIEIERDSARIKVFIHCARPGVIIGKGGQEIEKLRADVEKRVGKPVSISIVEIKNADANAQLVAENIAQQLEKRIGFRRAMKNAMQRAMRLGIRGIKVMVAGRLGGAEIARSETYHEGTIPLQTLRADIDYGFAEAATTYGRIGVKVWVYNGEILSQALRSTPRTMDLNKPIREPRERRNNDRRDNRSGGNRSSGGGYQGGNRSGGSSSGGSSGGYQGGNRSSGGSSGGYQGGSRPAGQSSGYQGGSRPAGQGYQGNRPAGTGTTGGTRPAGYNPRPNTNQPRPATPTPAATPAPAAPTPETNNGEGGQG
jgi:small subunit ribosomal protein S3